MHHVGSNLHVFSEGHDGRKDADAGRSRLQADIKDREHIVWLGPVHGERLKESGCIKAH